MEYLEIELKPQLKERLDEFEKGNKYVKQSVKGLKDTISDVLQCIKNEDYALAFCMLEECNSYIGATLYYNKVGDKFYSKNELYDNLDLLSKYLEERYNEYIENVLDSVKELKENFDELLYGVLKITSDYVMTEKIKLYLTSNLNFAYYVIEIKKLLASIEEDEEILRDKTGSEYMILAPITGNRKVRLKWFAKLVNTILLTVRTWKRFNILYIVY